MSTDTERLDWLQARHTLHKAVEILYVVDGYELTITYDGNPVHLFASRPSIREAIDEAMRVTDHNEG